MHGIRPPLQLRNIEFGELYKQPTYSNDAPPWTWRPDVAYYNLQAAHEACRDDFLDPIGFGAILGDTRRVGDISRVAGFIEHAFHFPLPRLKPKPASNANGESNARLKQQVIERVELVSVLRLDEPRAYVLDHLPRMDQLARADVATRALDEAERNNLEKLWHDADAVLWTQGDKTRMLGSLRAGFVCLRCHSVERGQLLGAFSYWVATYETEK